MYFSFFKGNLLSMPFYCFFVSWNRLNKMHFCWNFSNMCLNSKLWNCLRNYNVSDETPIRRPPQSLPWLLLMLGIIMQGKCFMRKSLKIGFFFHTLYHWREKGLNLKFLIHYLVQEDSTCCSLLNCRTRLFFCIAR